MHKVTQRLMLRIVYQMLSNLLIQTELGAQFLEQCLGTTCHNASLLPAYGHAYTVSTCGRVRHNNNLAAQSQGVHSNQAM